MRRGEKFFRGGEKLLRRGEKFLRRSAKCFARLTDAGLMVHRIDRIEDTRKRKSYFMMNMSLVILSVLMSVTMMMTMVVGLIF